MSKKLKPKDGEYWWVRIESDELIPARVSVPAAFETDQTVTAIPTGVSYPGYSVGIGVELIRRIPRPLIRGR